MKKLSWVKPFNPVYENDNDPFIPELWANESILLLTENIVAAGLVHRDFQPEIANFGDVVNTRKPAAFEAKRKTDADEVEVQDASAENIQVPLNQHIHTSFMIRDGEESKSFKDLVNEYLSPAMIAQARIIDQIVLGQYAQFLMNSYGTLGGLTETTAKAAILGTRLVMNNNKAYMAGRNLILTPNAETEMLKLDIFITADKVGDDGTALREASLGRKLGFNFFMCQNMASVAVGNTKASGTVNLAAGYPVGTTAITVAGFAAAITNGSWVSIGGQPYRVVSTTGGAAPTVITIAAPGLRSAVANSAVVSAYTNGDINLVAGYAEGYAKDITVSTFSVAPQVGQFVSFGTNSTSPIYTIIKASTTSITLDRPLEEDLANGDNVNIGPAGEYNLAFHRNAIALVVRPLAPPKRGTGALSGVANASDFSMRTTITYDGRKQGHLVTFDMLCGVAILDTDLGAVLLG
jgi:hypothetical protein